MSADKFKTPMKILVKIIALIGFSIFFTSTIFSSERQAFDNLPDTPQYVIPDLNFTNVTYGFPTAPQCQVMANGHLYVAFGSYLGIYEIQSDGTLIETCMKMMPHYLIMLDHDGDYLYTTGRLGISIYEGNTFGDPQLVGHCALRRTEFANMISAQGDSIYYSFVDSSSAIERLGILYIVDRSAPYVAGEFAEISSSSMPPPMLKCNHYLIMERRDLRDNDFYIAVLDLEVPSGVPTDGGEKSPRGRILFSKLS